MLFVCYQYLAVRRESSSRTEQFNMELTHKRFRDAGGDRKLKVLISVSHIPFRQAQISLTLRSIY